MDMMYDKIEQAKSTGSFDERDLATLDAGNVDVIFEEEKSDNKVSISQSCSLARVTSSSSELLFLGGSGTVPISGQIAWIFQDGKVDDEEIIVVPGTRVSGKLHSLGRRARVGSPLA